MVYKKDHELKVWGLAIFGSPTGKQDFFSLIFGYRGWFKRKNKKRKKERSFLFLVVWLSQEGNERVLCQGWQFQKEEGKESCRFLERLAIVSGKKGNRGILGEASYLVKKRGVHFVFEGRSQRSKTKGTWRVRNFDISFVSSTFIHSPN